MSMQKKIYFKKLAVIPAKALSIGIPNKNLRDFNGRHLFEWSVLYAIQEGFVPVVSTDSDVIIKWCEDHNINYYREIVDESRLENCLHQVLSKYDCEFWAMLQPTSPLRWAGMLATMQKTLEESPDKEVIFSSDDIKVVGNLDGEGFVRGYRRQDPRSRILHWFDGSIIVGRKQTFLNNDSLFGAAPESMTNEFPCTIQLDKELEFITLELISKHDKFKCLLSA